MSTPWFRALDEGSTTFGDWSFSWTINGHHEGLAIMDVRWKGVKVIHKASLPVIRVKYRGEGKDIFDGCGPFADRMGGSVKTDDYLKKELGYEFDEEVNVAWRIFEFDPPFPPLSFLEMMIYDEIGGYELFQSWIFWSNGGLKGQVGSGGWSCPHLFGGGAFLDHHHHTYWRVDFDVETISNELSLFITPQTGSTIFLRPTLESQDRRFPSEKLVGVEVRSLSSSKNVRAFIEFNELSDPRGSPWFNFSNKDIAWRLWKPHEDIGWPFEPEQHLGFTGFLGSQPENIDQKDIVVWFVAHLAHHWSRRDEEEGEAHYKNLTIIPSW